MHRHVLAALGCVACVLALGGCSPPKYLNALLTPAELSTRVHERFSIGMTLPEVETALDDANVPEGWRFRYPPRADGTDVYLARLYEPGGPWRNDGYDSTIRWIDLAFLFSRQGTLESAWSYRDNVRYAGRGVAFGPNRPPMKPVGYYPLPIPPPKDPLQDATKVLP